MTISKKSRNMAPSIDLRRGTAEQLEVSVDAVSAGVPWFFCSVPNLSGTLQEIWRHKTQWMLVH